MSFSQVPVALPGFILCAVGLLYIYLGYPALVWLLARLASHPARRQGLPDAYPTCSVLIPCYREGAALLAKIQHLLDSPSSHHIGEIVIGFDGPLTEGEPGSGEFEALGRPGAPGVRTVVFPLRRGKASVVNELAAGASGEVLVLTDARQLLHPEAIGQLLANFADESVGVVSGELVFRTEPDADGAASHGMGFYWRYEKFIRRCEGRFRSVPGATGALYAIRRTLLRSIPPATILDDVAIPMLAVVHGYRCVFEPAAEAYDVPSATVEKESLRKRRTIAGAAQLVHLFPEWLLPWKNPIWLEYVSHKLLRLASPLLLAGLLASNLALLASPWFVAFGVVQLGFYGLAALGGLLQWSGRRADRLGVPMMFVALNVITAMALWDSACGRFRVAWSK